ncbi:MAG: low molecular weight phosphotyrosine protein phosphatase [Ilumatobacteraceae bacterium]|nr:low molecular weight phosphotyrosine protein phosphatase [Ilumatobacteraceae bacterium]
MAANPPTVSVLFVCLGNHCRSPSAHAVANAMARNDGGIEFDSAGTSRAHVGDVPHPLAISEGALRGYSVDHFGRQVHPDDFARFELIIAMDRMNVDDLERMRGGVEHRTGHVATVEPVQVQLLRRWDPYAMPGDEDLPDPWAQPRDAYGTMFDVIERSIPPLLEHLAWLHSGRLAD